MKELDDYSLKGNATTALLAYKVNRDIALLCCFFVASASVNMPFHGSDDQVLSLWSVQEKLHEEAVQIVPYIDRISYIFIRV